MNQFRKYILVAAALLVTTAASSQTLNSLYFLEGNNQRHRLNPAFTSERGFVTFPLLGNLNPTLNSNIGLGTVLYPQGDEMVTFMHPSISNAEAMAKFKSMNVLEFDLNLDILTVGFNAWGGSNTIGLSLRSQSGFYLPKGIFQFLKEGQTASEQEYNIDDLGAQSQNYVELALGHSHKITDKLSVGAKVKVLVGALYAKASAENMRIYMSDNEWRITERSRLITSKGINYEFDEDGYLSDFDFSNFGVAGYGLGFDLGTVYRINEAATVSLAITDIGFMSWKNVTRADAASEFLFDGFEGIVTDEDDPAYEGNSIDDQMEQLGDDLEDFFRFRENKSKTKSTKALAATLNIGAEYVFPYYDKLTFAFLSSTRINGKYSSSEGRFYANVAPVNWFEASINYACSSYGSSFGWLLNFHPRGFNFFIGSDTQFFKVSPQFIPVGRANANISFGINFPFDELID